MDSLLNIRLRSVAYLAAVIPATLLAPSRGGLGGMEAFASPTGAVLASLLVLVAGNMVESRGGIASIRAAAAISVLAALGLVAAMAFAFSTARDVRLERVESWTWPVTAALLAHFTFCTVIDAGRALDPRFGRALRLIAMDDSGIRLRSRAGEITIPLTAVHTAKPGHWRDAWFVEIELRSREKIVGPAEALPWRPRDSQSRTFELTEHQLAMTAADFAARVNAQIERLPPYR